MLAGIKTEATGMEFKHYYHSKKKKKKKESYTLVVIDHKVPPASFSIVYLV